MVTEKLRPMSVPEPDEKRQPTAPASNIQLAIGNNGSSRERVRELPVPDGVPQFTLPEQKGRQASTDATVRSLYVTALRTAIERFKEYPLMARRQRLEGIVKVSCQISREGELRDARVVSTAGYSILDSAALRTVRSVGRFPPVPIELEGEPFSFVAPITFRLTAD